jgi:hypothetical protein
MVKKMCEIADKNPKLIWGDKREWDPRSKKDLNNALLTDTSFASGFREYYEKTAYGK